MIFFRFWISNDQRIEGRSGGIGPGGSQQKGDEVPVVDHVRRILRSQLDTRLLIDQQTGIPLLVYKKTQFPILLKANFTILFIYI